MTGVLAAAGVAGPITVSAPARTATTQTMLRALRMPTPLERRRDRTGDAVTSRRHGAIVAMVNRVCVFSPDGPARRSGGRPARRHRAALPGGGHGHHAADHRRSRGTWV